MATHSSITDPPSIRKLLERIGLDDREAEVYLALLPLTSARASDIAKASKQSRSHTYLILRSLRDKGLVSEVEKGKVIEFAPEPPNRLMAYLQDREEEMRRLQVLTERALPQLETLSTTLDGQPRVTFLTGLEGMKRVYRDALMGEFRGIFNAESMYNLFQDNVFIKLFGKDVYLRGKDLLVDNEAAARYTKEIPQHDEYHIKLFPKEMAFTSDTLIYGDTICLFAYDDERTIVRIENRNLANTFRAWHEMMWAMSG